MLKITQRTERYFYLEPGMSTKINTEFPSSQSNALYLSSYQIFNKSFSFAGHTLETC